MGMATIDQLLNEIPDHDAFQLVYYPMPNKTGAAYYHFEIIRADRLAAKRIIQADDVTPEKAISRTIMELMEAQSQSGVSKETAGGVK